MSYVRDSVRFASRVQKRVATAAVAAVRVSEFWNSGGRLWVRIRADMDLLPEVEGECKGFRWWV